MIHILRFVFMLTIWGSSISAQTVFVRSGEHDRFTRLVMQLPHRVDWSISEGDRSAEINIAIPGLKFDTRQVFGRIPRTRLTDLNQPDENRGLVLSLGCDCIVSGFTQSDTLLVVDIADPIEKPQQPVTWKLPTNLLAYRFSHGRPLPLTEPDRKVSLPVVTNMTLPSDPVVPIDPNTPVVVTDQPRHSGINRSEQRLLEQIGRASDQGLLRLVTNRADLQNDTDQSARHLRSREPNTAQLNVSALTVVDRDMSGVPGEISQFATITECLPSDLVALDRWGDDREFSQQISTLRSELYGEFDRLDPVALSNLAKTYLHFGFGAEALDVLDMAPSLEPDQTIYHALAVLLDGKSLETDNPFSQQQSCNSDVSLWAALTEPGLARNSDAAAVMRAFVRLPRHLRTHLGPRLSQIFIEADRTDLASSLLRAIDRSEDNSNPEHELAKALIENSNGRAEMAVEMMSDVIDTDSEHSPQALIELIDTLWTARLPIQPDLPELASAYATQYRTSELGPDLQRAKAIALALSGQFEEAFSTLALTMEQDGPSEFHSAVVPVLTLLTENADDVSFLKYTLARIKEPRTGFPPDLENDMARRLLNLGFPEQVLTFLSNSTSQPASERRRMMRAEAALATGLPHQAMIELLSVTGSEAATMRARALWQAGDYQLAGHILRDANQIDEATRSFWLANSWDDISYDDTSRYARVAEVSSQLNRQIAATSDDAPLAAARALLKDSETARREIQELLSNVQMAREAQ